MQPVTRVFVCLLIGASTGCGCWESRKCCPIYQPNHYLIGSEAVRQGPCGPDELFYGMKKTCWREWPAEWQTWPACGDVTVESHVEPQPYVAPYVSEPIPAANDTRAWAPATSAEPRRTSPLPRTETPPAADAIDVVPSSDTSPASPVGPPLREPEVDPVFSPFEQSSWLQPTVPRAELHGPGTDPPPDVIDIERPASPPASTRAARVSGRPPKPARLRR
jgi:hypothetical protein